MKTGKLIEAIMHYKHVGIQELANKIGIEEPNMATLITGRRNITPALAEKIGDVLDIEPIVIMTNRMMEELKDCNRKNLERAKLQRWWQV